MGRQGQRLERRVARLHSESDGWGDFEEGPAQKDMLKIVDNDRELDPGWRDWRQETG